jgi:hypothetical protein
MSDRSNMTFLGVAPVTVDERSGKATFNKSDIRYSPEFGGVFQGTPSEEAIRNTGAAWGNYSGTPSEEAIRNTGAAWGNYSGSAAATEEWWQGAAGSEPWGDSPYAMQDGSFGEADGYDADDPYAESFGGNVSEDLLGGRLAGFGDWYPSQESTADLPWSEGAYATQDGGSSFGAYDLETADWADGMVNQHSTGSEPWGVPVGQEGNNPSFGRTNKAPKILSPRQARSRLGRALTGKLTSTSSQNIATVAVPVGPTRVMVATAKVEAARVFKKAGLFRTRRAAMRAAKGAEVVRAKSGQRPLQIPGPPGPLFLIPIPLQVMIVRIAKTQAQKANASGTTGKPAPRDHRVASPGGGSAQPGVASADNQGASWSGRATDALAAADAAHQAWVAQGLSVQSPYAVYDDGGGRWTVEGKLAGGAVVWDESLFEGEHDDFEGEHDDYYDEY